MYNEGIRTFAAGEILAANRRVKLTTGTANQVEYADAADDFIGVTLILAVAIGDSVSVKLKNAEGSVEVEAAGAITVNTVIYGAADGKVSASSTNNDKFGRAFEAASGDGAIIEAVIDSDAA